MTDDEIRKLVLDLAPKPADLDRIFYRDLRNHVSMFGPASIVRKRGRGWVTEFRGHGHPEIFKTKREAVDMASRWVLATKDK